MSVVISPSFTTPLSVVTKLAAGIDDPSATTPAPDFSNVNSAWSSVLAAVDFSEWPCPSDGPALSGVNSMAGMYSWAYSPRNSVGKVGEAKCFILWKQWIN
ncbi:hypothetical protein TSUD_180440 [Trifolium subterraneum]|uniref:Uncharacterized protein n=1 Tax=Trifolium subterraneum TaxID=3900 RepID=A0A2Z6PAY0_TRISU|nr:hypothetical protein TSUD_180440 [Trifolium subterraneum]